MAGQKTPTALGTENIGKLLMQYAVPAIIAMTASSLYNMVDSIFIGHGVGTMAISGLALTFPLMNLAAAFGSLVGVGAATLISVKLGQKDYDTAQRVLGNVFVLNILLGVAFTVVVMAFLDPILYFFGGSDETVGYARDYMQIILLGNRYASLSGVECGAAFFGASAEGDVCHHCHGDYQHDTRPAFHLHLRYGNPGSRRSNHSGTDHFTLLAHPHLLQQGRASALSKRHLPSQRRTGRKYHRHRYGSVPDEHGFLLYCHPDQ